eukprot:Em0060g10a
MWFRFNVGEYDKLSKLTAAIRRRPRYTNDHKVVAMWFDSLISMHRDGNHASSISNHLLPALELCCDSENRLILEGRIYQRMSQLYLVLGLKELADRSIAQAECCLHLVARGYEQVNMLCRRAKLLSATADADKRNVVEELYVRALAAINDDDPFIMASRPSIILSTAAFYLHMSFGAKPNPTDPPPHIPEADIVKAKAVLTRLPHSEVVLEMRKCELKIQITKSTKVFTAAFPQLSYVSSAKVVIYYNGQRNAHPAQFLAFRAIGNMPARLATATTAVPACMPASSSKAGWEVKSCWLAQDPGLNQKVSWMGVAVIGGDIATHFHLDNPSGHPSEDPDELTDRTWQGHHVPFGGMAKWVKSNLRAQWVARTIRNLKAGHHLMANLKLGRVEMKARPSEGVTDSHDAT